MNAVPVNLTSPGDICAEVIIHGQRVIIPLPEELKDKVNANGKVPLPDTTNAAPFDVDIVRRCSLYDSKYISHTLDCEPYLAITTEDSYISHAMTSRAMLEDLIVKLRAKADELWPSPATQEQN